MANKDVHIKTRGRTQSLVLVFIPSDAYSRTNAYNRSRLAAHYRFTPMLDIIRKLIKAFVTSRDVHLQKLGKRAGLEIVFGQTGH
jgi:hypothetical protein